MLRHPAPAAVALTVLLAAPIMAQMRHADSHVHGTAQLTLVMAQGQVSMALSIPAADIVGFERQPRDDQEEAAIAEVIQSLSDPLSLFSFSPDPGCELASSEIGFLGESEDDHHDHADEDEHDHEGHFEFVASYRLERPAIPSSGLSLETKFFEIFPGLASVQIEGLIEGSAIRATLAPDTPSIALGSPG
jgi:hypothetical protein